MMMKKGIGSLLLVVVFVASGSASADGAHKGLHSKKDADCSQSGEMLRQAAAVGRYSAAAYYGKKIRDELNKNPQSESLQRLADMAKKDETYFYAESQK